ncbi:hypothetical protein [Anaerotruncus sp. 1XD42-93]|uniref:hypothetical protein n=1 Tax=Anaerotruncus sp. 1XD42-93 TaxID=2320853 RepID=UPI000EA0EBA0|nr:hypothetical protein [Anaerotruncus sp. 1XD42-93]NBK17696.1 hypothetical protein [Anaerotruncus sp. 1XD42-93]RKJ88873.1 hypothetical protein D7Y41_17355 [Anaerotruncus sp. 1XD22-93]
MNELIEYRCKGTYRGKLCRKLLCRASPGHQIEVRCDRCKQMNVFGEPEDTKPNQQERHERR